MVDCDFLLLGDISESAARPSKALASFVLIAFGGYLFRGGDLFGD